MMARVTKITTIPAPKTMPCGGHEVEVRLVQGLAASTGNVGTCCVATNLIEIDDGLDSESKTVTLIHENIELVNTIWRLNMDHDDIDRLSEAFYQSLCGMGIEIDWS